MWKEIAMVDKKVLLINPKFTEEVSIFNIPISLLYLGSWLTSKGYPVQILDALHFKSEDSLRSRIVTELSKSSYIGFTVMSTQIPHALELSRLVKKYSSSIPIIWGGAHPTLYPEQTLASEYIDYVVVGDGEEALEGLCKNQITNGGIIYGGTLDIDKIPGVDWNLLGELETGVSLSEMSNLTEFGLPILASKGCPHKCAFCINSVLGVKYRQRNIRLVLRDIKDALWKGITRLEFVDECLLASKKRVNQLVDEISKEGLKFDWAAGSRTDYFRNSYLDIPFLKKLRNAGCWFIGTGAESGSQRILDRVNKGTKVEDTLNMARKMKEVGIRGNFSFMIGLPGEELEDYKATLSLISKLVRVNPDVYILGPQTYRPYPGSKLYEECKAYGMRVPQNLEEWAQSPYIHFEFSSKKHYLKEYYPWVQFKGDLPTLIFYTTLMGLRPRFKPVTKVLRLIGRIRCKLFFFKFPILKIIYGLLRNSWIEKFLRQRRII